MELADDCSSAVDQGEDHEMRAGEKAEKLMKCDIVTDLLSKGMAPREISRQTGISESYVYHLRVDSFDVLMYEWEDVTERLKRSGYDLSKIKLTKRRPA